MTSFKTAMNKKYGEGNDIFSNGEYQVFESISSGSAILDGLLGNGGWVRGRIHEIFGESGSGKSTIVSLTCANARRQYPDKYILYVDAEQAQNFSYMKKLGLDCENDEGVVFLQMQEAENVFEIIDSAIATGAFSLVIVDSVPALMTKRELNGDYDKETMAEKARFLSKSLPKLLESLKKADTTMIFVNQVRDKMDLWGGQTTPGGKAIPFYCSSRVKINSTPSMRIKNSSGDGFIGQTVGFTIIKNKVGSPFGVGESNLYFGIGFNRIEELIDSAISKDVFEKGGAWYTLPYCTEDGEVLKFQGKTGLKAYYEANPSELDRLQELVNGAGRDDGIQVVGAPGTTEDGY
jgi:recA bacterial DNA recombination protein|nr:MAG TPA: Protein recA [Bacteriophage sp.]DAY34804.1 MAG TPA: Protein recA [Bacteriophage sp.]